MANDQTLQISAVDFDSIKSNLTDYLRNRDEFSDYVFAGSAISYLLNILSYATYYNAVHTNLAFAETFLDSATLRGSVVSRAKELGYTPRSKSAAKANITLSFAVSGNPSEYIIPKNTRFSSSNGSNNYTFVTSEDIVVSNVSNVFTKDIEIAQGVYTTYSYTVNTSNPLQRFIVPDKNVDTKFLTVSYKQSVSDTDYTIVEYIKNISLADVTGVSNTYLMSESYDGYYQLHFGDDVVGRSMKNGNVIRLEYLITDGFEANQLQNFSLASSLPNVAGMTITTTNASNGGDERESIERIKYLAPFYYSAQDRAVTADDYRSIIANNYSNIQDISVWGGEKNIPPYYGKVFIAIKPRGNTTFSNTTKLQIQNDILQRFNVVSVRPEIVDPDYTYVYVNTVVTYNGRLLNSTGAGGLTQAVKNSITEFFANNVNKFAQPLYYSKLVGAIDDTSPLIKNSVTNLIIEKSLEISPGINNLYKYTFNNAIYPGSVKSNEFMIDGLAWKMKDVPNGSFPYTTGNIIVYRVDGQNQTFLLQASSGSVNYQTGLITINDLRVDSIVNDPIFKLLSIQVAPGALIDLSKEESIHVDQNVYSNGREQIIVLKDNGLFVDIIPDNT